MPTPVRRWGPWILLGAVVVVVLAVASRPDGDPTVDERVQSLSARLACPECVAESVADSSSEVSAQIRAEIRVFVEDGRSDEEILDYYVRQKGDDILLMPEAEGVGLLVYAVPVAVVAVGLLGLGLAMRRWRREPSLVASADDLVLVARERTHGPHDDDGSDAPTAETAR